MSGENWPKPCREMRVQLPVMTHLQRDSFFNNELLSFQVQLP
jgi:hypothetical protein